MNNQPNPAPAQFNPELNPAQHAAFEEFLTALYEKLAAQKSKPGKVPTVVQAEYEQAASKLTDLGVDLKDMVLWGTCSLDVLHSGREESFVYHGCLLRDEREVELLVYSGNIQHDYTEALLRCFGEVEVGSSCWKVIARSGCLQASTDPAVGSILAYRVGCDPESHKSQKYAPPA